MKRSPPPATRPAFGGGRPEGGAPREGGRSYGGDREGYRGASGGGFGRGSDKGGAPGAYPKPPPLGPPATAFCLKALLCPCCSAVQSSEQAGTLALS